MKLVPPSTSASSLAVDVITNGRDYMRAKIVEPSGGHELSWYQRVEGGQWEHKRRPLTDEEAVMMQAAFQDMIRDGGGTVKDCVYDVMGLERGQDVSLCQLTMYDKSRLRP
jgi:hypothetical protein